MKKLKKTIFLFTFFLLYKLSLGATFNVSTPEEFITALNEAVQNNEEDKIILSAGNYYFFEPISAEISDKKSLSIIGEDPNNRPKLYFEIPAEIFAFFINYPENTEPGYLKFKNLVFTVDLDLTYHFRPFGLFVKTYQKDIIFENCLISKFSFEGLEAISKKGNVFLISSKIEDIEDDITPDQKPTYIGPETLVVPMRNNIYILNSSLFSEFYTKGLAGDIKIINSVNNNYNEEGLSFNGKHIDISFSNLVFEVGRGYEINFLNIKANTVEIHNSKINKANLYSNNISLVSNEIGTADPIAIDPYYTYLRIYSEDANKKAIYNIVNNTIKEFITLNSNTDTDFNFYNNITISDITANMTKGKSNSFKFFNNIFSEDINFGTPSEDYFNVNSGNLHLKNVSDLVVSGNIFNVKDRNQIKLLAKDSGYNNAPRLEDYPYDIDNDVRIYGESVDIGANEFVDPDKKESKLLFAYLLPSSTNINRPVYIAFSVFAKDNDSLTCEVDFNNDGNPEYKKENCKRFQYVSHIYKQEGTYPIKLTVKKGDRFIARKDFLAIVSDVEDKLLNIQVNVGNLDEENNLPVSVSIDNDFPVICKWHIKYVNFSYVETKHNDLYYRGGIVTDCSSATLPIKEGENVYIFLEVDDTEGNVIDLLPVTKLNLSNRTFKSYPTGKVHLNKTKGYTPLTVQLELQPVMNETPPKKCYIDFDGDGNYEEIINDCYLQTHQLSYTYENPGTYILKIVFEDENGNTSSKTFQIIASKRTINNPPKIKDFRYTREGRVPLYATFKIEVEDPDGDTITCKIDFEGDGNFDKTVENCNRETLHHVYIDPGIYRPIVLAIDSGKQKSVKTGYIIAHNFYRKIRPDKKYFSLHFSSEIFKALRTKYKIPVTLKDKSLVIIITAKPKYQNGTIYLYPSISSFPIVGEEFIAKNNKYDFPFGLLNIRLSEVLKGSKVCITEQIPGYIPKNAIFVKYSKNGKMTPLKNVYSSYDGKKWKKGLIAGYRFIKYCALEGGRFDEDGKANGVFVDPAGLAVPAGSYNPSNPPENNQNGEDSDNNYNYPDNNNSTNTIQCSGGSGCFLNKKAPLSDILPFAIILFVFLLRKIQKGGGAV